METKEYWLKKAQTIEGKILELQAQLAKVQNYIKNETFPKKNGKKAKTIVKKEEKNDSGWI